MSKSEEEKRIADAAYHLWEKEGRPQGKDMDLWLRARAELEASEAAPKKRRAPARKAAPAKPKATAAKPKAPARPKAAAAAAKPAARTAKPKAKPAKT